MADNSDTDKNNSIDTWDEAIDLPAGKLDADEYSADDLDGVTESVFGSGNMAYASLQASQTDAALADQNAQQSAGDDALDLAQDSPVARGNADVFDDTPNNSRGTPQNNNFSTNTDRPNDQVRDSSGGSSSASEGNYSTSTVGSAGASQLSSDDGAYGSGGGMTISEGLDGEDGESGEDGSSSEKETVSDGKDGQDGKDGNDGGSSGGNTTITNNYYYDIDVVDLGDTSNLINQSFVNLGDTISTLTVSINDISKTLVNTINDIDIVSINDVTSITETLIAITENLDITVTNVLNEVNIITKKVTNILEGELDTDFKDLEINVDVNAVDTVITNVNVPLSKPLSGDNDLDIDFAPVTNITNNLIELTGLDILGDVLAELNGAVQFLQTTINQVTNTISDLDSSNTISESLTSINVTITETTEIIEATVEDILEGVGLGENGDTDGDVGVDVDIDMVHSDVLNESVDALIDPVEDLTGDIDVNLGVGADILGDSETDNAAGDSDVTLSPDIDVVDTDILGGDVEVELDIVENVTGDIDVDVDAAADALADTADNIVNEDPGGTGEDTALAELGDDLNDLASEIIPGLNTGDDAESDVTVDSNVDLVDDNLANADLDSVLDPVEEIAGDIDASINADADLLDDDADIDNHGEDEDLDIDTDVELVDQTVGDVHADAPLDSAEALIGDVDIDVDVALDLLDTDEAENGSEENNWTESTIEDGGGLFGDIVDGLGGENDALPDPAGTVAEGIGALDVDPELDTGSTGGLFG